MATTPAVAPAQRVAAPIALPRTILFIGNSFTQGAHSAVRNWHADRVTDLNRAGFGGVPALFKEFTEEAGLRYAVSLETQGGQSLAFHYDQRRHLFDRAWDVVVLQEYSTLDRERPGDPTRYIRSVGQLGSLFRVRNHAVRVELMATWSRADQVYQPGTPWSGRGVFAMADDLRAAADRARRTNRSVSGVIPVGQAWNRAFAARVADPDPYDGVTFGQANLWSYDQYHASTAGYYLEALVTFGQVTGVDPRTLGRGERAADELGLSPDLAASLQLIAYEQLAAR
ncbi:PEP-CTERM sorting domain-containing protein [Sphingomonas sp. RP10(2022)]|uniref:PEP-CTERM sorting domain-containing protein n=2 Tax=Sphingomonas liriopis TaxID=2949094 RepID=A0A9X2HS12_9SPHN|nr:PEP-CTERM sorting domain-containing protein [Sphingomonas liriopis]MCP3734384.1 PEP-CTERM sorting domain-containing protein [Sphingomonas liriopis]